MSDREERRRRTLLGMALVAVFLGLFVVALRAPSRRGAPRGTVDASASSVVGYPADPAAPQADPTVARAPSADAGAASVRDRAVRDRIRAEIVRAWSAQGGVAPPSPPSGAPIPPHVGRLRAEFIRDRIREDFVPMAQACYESLLTRRPGAQGRVAMEFEIVADANHGGLVEDARFLVDDAAVPDAGVWEGEFLTCMRESMLTVAFLRPEGEGRVTVRYPFVLREAPDAG